MFNSILSSVRTAGKRGGMFWCHMENRGSVTDKIKSLHLDINHGNTKYAASRARFPALGTQGPTWQAEEGILVRFRHGFFFVLSKDK